MVVEEDNSKRDEERVISELENATVSLIKTEGDLVTEGELQGLLWPFAR